MKNTMSVGNTRHTSKETGEDIWDSRSVAACVMLSFVNIDKEEGERFLITKRSHKMSHGGLYCLPCGHLDKGETIIQAASRELFEETGIRIETEYLNQYEIDDNPNSFRENITHHYACTVYGDATTLADLESEITLQEEECLEAFFATKEEIEKLDFAFGHKDRLLESF